MTFPILVTTDLHLTDSPSAEYRWGLFDWMNAQIKKHKVKTVLILGDLCDVKDRHSAALVNKVVKYVNNIVCDDVRIMAGNHDWLKTGEVFFKFLNHLPHVEFITDITLDGVGVHAVFLPYSKTPKSDWEKVIEFQKKHGIFDYVFMHQTVKGAVASNGQIMEGEEVVGIEDLDEHTRVLSGDIHVPQVIGRVEYVGSPFPVHFGDDYKPRCLLLRGFDDEEDLHFKTIKRMAITIDYVDELEAKDLRQGDQIKLRIKLTQAEKHDWLKIKREATEYLEGRGIEVHGVELLLDHNKPVLTAIKSHIDQLDVSSLVERFVNQESLGGDVLDAGLDIVGDS